jgi:hypothetical protein
MMTAEHLRTLEEKPSNRIVLASSGITGSTLVMATDEIGVPFLLRACRGQGMTPLAIVRARRPWVETPIVVEPPVLEVSIVERSAER